MRKLTKLCFIFFSLFMFSTAHADNKQFIKDALAYGFDMNTHDYTKYMSKDYIEHIDGKTFDFEQWVHHMEGLKTQMQSYDLSYDEMVAEGDQLATSYVVHATKKDGSKLDICIIAIFKLKDNKIIYCDELTHLLSGDEKDKHLAFQD